MADTKISDLTDGVTVQAADRIPIARAGDNRYITGTELAVFIEATVDALANLTSIQGRTVTLADAGADAIFGWDDSASAYENLTQGEVRTVAGLATTDSPTFADVTVTDEAYGVGWDSDLTVPTKNAVYDKIEGITGRTKMTEDTTFYVRTMPVTATMTQASPGVVTSTAHGLSVNDPVVFSVPTQRKSFTVTQAASGVITCASHGLAIGDPFCVRTTGALPTNMPTFIINGTATIRNACPRTYYVIATSFGANSFQFSTTAGGAAVNTTAGSNTGTHILERARFIEKGTCTLTAANNRVTFTSHGLVVGDEVAFNTTGDLLTGVESFGTWSDTYFVRAVVDANNFTLMTAIGGAEIDLTGSQSGTHTLFKGNPFLATTVGGSATGPLQEGGAYYVKTVPTADTFTISETVGGTVIDTVGTQLGKVWLSTGNDDNDGLAQTRTGAFLTPNAAWMNIHQNIDMGDWQATIQCADGSYHGEGGGGNITSSLDITTMPIGGTAFGAITIQGNSSDRSAVRFSVPQQHTDNIALASEWNGTLDIQYLDIYNPSFAAINLFGYNQTVRMRNFVVSGVTPTDPHFIVSNYANFLASDFDVLFGSAAGEFGSYNGMLTNYRSDVWLSETVRFFNDPLFGNDGGGGDVGVHYSEGPCVTRLGMTLTGTYTGAGGETWYPGARLQGGTYPGGTANNFGGKGEVVQLPADEWAFHFEASQVFTEVVNTTAKTVNTLPAAATAGAGARSFVTDANSAVFKAAVVAGGSNKVPVHSDGTGWFIG